MAAIRILMNDGERVSYIQENVAFLRKGLLQLGYEVLTSPSAILPIMISETATAIRYAKKMLDYGILITGFGYPVVPEGKARLRIQVSAVHTRNHLDKVLEAFAKLKA